MIRTVHLFPIILKVVSIGHDLSSGILQTVSMIEQFLSGVILSFTTYMVTNYGYESMYINELIYFG